MSRYRKQRINIKCRWLSTRFRYKLWIFSKLVTIQSINLTKIFQHLTLTKMLQSLFKSSITSLFSINTIFQYFIYQQINHLLRINSIHLRQWLWINRLFLVLASVFTHPYFYSHLSRQYNYHSFSQINLDNKS